MLKEQYAEVQRIPGQNLDLENSPVTVQTAASNGKWILRAGRYDRTAAVARWRTLRLAMEYRQKAEWQTGGRKGTGNRSRGISSLSASAIGSFVTDGDTMLSDRSAVRPEKLEEDLSDLRARIAGIESLIS